MKRQKDLVQLCHIFQQQPSDITIITRDPVAGHEARLFFNHLLDCVKLPAPRFDPNKRLYGIAELAQVGSRAETGDIAILLEGAKPFADGRTSKPHLLANVGKTATPARFEYLDNLTVCLVRLFRHESYMHQLEPEQKRISANATDVAGTAVEARTKIPKTRHRSF